MMRSAMQLHSEGSARRRRHSSKAACAYLRYAGLWALAMTGLALQALAQQNKNRLADMSLEDLMNVEVTSVAKRQQPLAESAAAVFVITQDDIRRSGATSIPEALRLAPGVQVAQINAHVWAVSIRGFNYRYANKLLVLIDGRAVYTQVFSGVVWIVEDTVLEDIDRIEVIRGPGATLWGANAVNGVVNIITKNAQDTGGGLMTATASGHGGYGAVRYGAMAGKHLAFRVFGKTSGWVPRPNLPVMETDGWQANRGGFRADWNASASDWLTLSGDIFTGSADEAYIIPMLAPPQNLNYNAWLGNSGGDLLGRWSHHYVNGSESTLQTYFDRLEYNLPVAQFRMNVFDLDFQHEVKASGRQAWIFGAGYRSTSKDVSGSEVMRFNPSEQPWWQSNQKTRDLFSGFLQDEITIVRDRVILTVGSKFEHNEYTGFEYQPSVRLRWQPHARQTAWASVSRAVRTPSDYEEEGQIETSVMPTPQRLPAVVTLLGNRRLRAEQLLAYEAGYRVQVRRHTSFDLATFYNVYRDLVSETFEQPALELTPTPVHVVVPVRWGNDLHATSYGMEISGNYVPLSAWRITGSYSWLHINLKPADIVTVFPAGSNPEHSFQIRSSLSLPHNLELDNSFYYTGSLDAQPVPAYLRVDARLAWHAGERLEFSVQGQNLLRPLHREFAPSYEVEGFGQIGRLIYGKVTWRF